MRGGTGRAVVNPGTPHEQVLAPLSDGTVLRRGDILLLETGGGGGHGHPFDRPAEQVLQDVRDGFVSVEAARRDYGVAIAAMRWTKRPRDAARRDASVGEGVPPQGLCRCHRLTFAVAVDIGGTFTDITLSDSATGRQWRAKTPSTPADPSEAFLAGVMLALAEAGATAAGDRPRAAWHDGRHQPDPGRQDRAHRAGDHRRAFATCWRSAGRTFRARPTCSPG